MDQLLSGRELPYNAKMMAVLLPRKFRALKIEM